MLKGLKLRKKFGRGGTNIGMNRGHQLAEEEFISLDIIKRMSSYFARHEVDKKAENFGNNEKAFKRLYCLAFMGEVTKVKNGLIQSRKNILSKN